MRLPHPLSFSEWNTSLRSRLLPEEYDPLAPPDLIAGCELVPAQHPRLRTLASHDASARCSWVRNTCVHVHMHYAVDALFN
jgi:hypothetical protein